MSVLMGFLKTLLIWVLARAIARMLVGAGIALVTYNYLDDQVQGFLDQVRNSFSAFSASPFDILMMAGLGDALSIIGSALMTVAAIRAASYVLGVKLT